MLHTWEELSNSKKAAINTSGFALKTIDPFYNMLKQQGINAEWPKNKVTTYWLQCSHFERWCDSKSVEVLKASKEEVVKYIEHMI